MPDPNDRPRPASRKLTTSVPGYRIEGELGRGGMGVVYRAVQESLGRTVALKVVLSGVHVSERERRRFAAEARALASLQHANVVGVIDFGEADGLPWFALEFCPGGSLADRLQAGPLPPAQAAGVVATLARAVDAVHRRGLIHRDLKPANVLFTEDGTPKVADFGLARDEEGTGTVTGAALGTPAYMAPEQARGEKVDQRADVYALGAILYQCLTGRPPFSGPSAQVTLALVVTGQVGVIPPRQINPAVPEWLEAVCSRALARDPRHRYATAGELAAALALPVAETMPGEFALPVAEPPLAPVRGGVPLWAVLAAAAGCLALGCAASAAVFWAFAGRGPGPAVAATAPSGARPALLAAPFSAGEAQAAQKAWAAHLGEPVEQNIDLGGGEKLTLVLVPPGTFTMGSPSGEAGRFNDEGPAHAVTISRPFRIGKTEVTQAQYRAITGKSPSYFAPTGGGKGAVVGLDTSRLPVESVSWVDADDFCTRAARRSGRPVTLPTEAQWEWACRAGSQGRFFFGDREFELVSYANTGTRPADAGGKLPNPWGLYDVYGNVLEWCADWKDGYAIDRSTDPEATRPTGQRVLRGGGWTNNATSCRSAYREGIDPTSGRSNVGFRVAAAVPAR